MIEQQIRFLFIFNAESQESIGTLIETDKWAREY